MTTHSFHPAIISKHKERFEQLGFKITGCMATLPSGWKIQNNYCYDADGNCIFVFTFPPFTPWDDTVYYPGIGYWSTGLKMLGLTNKVSNPRLFDDHIGN